MTTRMNERAMTTAGNRQWAHFDETIGASWCIVNEVKHPGTLETPARLTLVLPHDPEARAAPARGRVRPTSITVSLEFTCNWRDNDHCESPRSFR